MNTEKIPARIARGLILIRDQASKLDKGGIDPNSFEAHIALKTIKDEVRALKTVHRRVDRADPARRVIQGA